ncbi:MAG: metal ABC transporter substrate-binding protein [Methanomicrobiales archaeon]
MAAELHVVSTTTVLADPVDQIGGEHVEVISLADPALCPHMQSDIIPNRLQMDREFIASADLFVAHNSSVDQSNVMPIVDDFMEANGYGTIDWVTLPDPSMTWNQPDNAEELASIVAGWLCDADPAHTEYYNDRLASYIEQIQAESLTEEEEKVIPGQDVIVMIWQRDAAEQWLGLDVVGIYAPEFYRGGKYTAAKLVDDIAANPETYRDVTYIIENMQSGELGKGIEEALSDRGIPAKRVIFTNFPKSVEGVNTIPKVLAYNKGLVTPGEDTPASEPTPDASPGLLPVLIGAGAAGLLVSRRS